MADVARGERMRDLREARHLSQEDAAHEIGVSVKTIRAWEKGSGIRWPNAKSAARFYGVEPESLVRRENGVEIQESDRLDEVLTRLAAIQLALGIADAHRQLDREDQHSRPADDGDMETETGD